MSRGFLVLCFDDGHVDAYTTAFPILEKWSFVGVVGAITSYVGRIWRDRLYDQYQDFELAGLSQLREMRIQGWEIASHSLTHSFYEWFLSGSQDANPTRLEISLRESKDWIVRNHLGDGRTFIYPFGAIPANAIDLVRKYYWLARSTNTTTPVYFDLPLDNYQKYRLSSYGVYHPLSSEELNEIRRLVRYAKERAAVIVLNFHRICDQPRSFDVAPNELETILDVVADEGVQTSTFERVIDDVWGPQAVTNMNLGQS
jgi:peptidoglycan/xylan/chitin deacetylase (PgdA/CDA1 family)